jgi:hypothetical protein
MQISEELRAFLEAAPFAVVCVPLDLGTGDEAAVLVKSTRDAIEGLRGADARIEVGWAVESTERGPVVCLLFRTAGEGAGDLVGEAYFDPSDEGDRRLFELLSRQEVLRVGFLDEELSIGWVRELAWGELRRLEADQVRDRAEQWLESMPEYDFDSARELFQERFALDELLERVFPPERPAR